MPTRQEAIETIRQWRRSSKLTVYRTTTPTSGEDYFVQRAGGPDGLTTDGVEIDKLRVKFNVEHDLAKHPNRCDIEITNLAPRSRAAMETRPLAVEFAAGHQDVNKILITGDVIYAMSEQDGTEWVTTLQIGDNARAFAGARVRKTYSKGTSIKSMLRDVARSLGQTLPTNIEQSVELDAKIGASAVVQGAAHAELTRLLAPYGYDWSFQNGRLQALRFDETRNDVLPVSEQTGMIGTPDFGQSTKVGKPPTMTIEHLLYPEVRPGGLIELKSRTRSGLFKVVKVRHTGDTDGDDWFTNFEVKPVSTTSRFGGGR